MQCRRYACTELWYAVQTLCTCTQYTACSTQHAVHSMQYIAACVCRTEVACVGQRLDSDGQAQTPKIWPVSSSICVPVLLMHKAEMLHWHCYRPDIKSKRKRSRSFCGQNAHFSELRYISDLTFCAREVR